MSKIEWTEKTWNPIVGCSVVSPGCTNCYAMNMAARIEAMNPGSHYAGTTQPSKAGPVWTGKMAKAPDKAFLAPLRRKKPTMYFVNSMGDPFHENVPDEWLDMMFAVMALCSQHTFQVLTKRSRRMREYCDGFAAWVRVESLIKEIQPSDLWNGNAYEALRYLKNGRPLPNVWLGVSAEDQRRANERIPDLLATPAAVRFLSAEPLLGWLHLTLISTGPGMYPDRRVVSDTVNALTGERVVGTANGYDRKHDWPTLDWVIVGGESGGSARPMHPDWARSIRDQCEAVGVPFFFKQWGEWAVVDGPQCKVTTKRSGRGTIRMFANGKIDSRASPYHAYVFDRIGKKAAGRLLDGRTWDGFPEVAE